MKKPSPPTTLKIKISPLRGDYPFDGCRKRQPCPIAIPRTIRRSAAAFQSTAAASGSLAQKTHPIARCVRLRRFRGAGCPPYPPGPLRSVSNGSDSPPIRKKRPKEAHLLSGCSCFVPALLLGASDWPAMWLRSHPRQDTRRNAGKVQQ